MDHVVVVVVGGDAGLPGEMVQAQMIVVLDPRVVVDGKAVVEVQPRHRHSDAGVRRPHTLKRRIV